MGLWDWLVNPAGLTPHGFCLLWAPGLIWLHAASDIVIGLAYFSIPLALAYYAHRRPDVRHRGVLLLFVAFILACGMTHFLAVYTLWVAAYGLEGIVKLVTACLSVGTAILLWVLMPRVLALPSAAQIEALNRSLSDKVAEQERTQAQLRASEEQVRRANAELEHRVAERTADLTDALRQRDLLLREVYHRVKNNLQIIDSVILLQSRALGDPVERQFVQSLRSRIHALGLVHQQLMSSPDLQTFDLAPFLKELTENILAAGALGDVVLEVDADPLSVTLDFAVPLGLLVAELVTNSLKYAYPDGRGRLAISVKVAPGDKVVVTVADDGPGLTQVPGGGEDASTGTGIGKKLIEGLLRQLNGEMDVSGDGGMVTRLTLPQPRGG